MLTLPIIFVCDKLPCITGDVSLERTIFNRIGEVLVDPCFQLRILVMLLVCFVLLSALKPSVGFLLNLSWPIPVCGKYFCFILFE